jgi:biopolymer transport protein ExbD
MGMSVGGAGGPKSDINMTPMIDVLLVLIIIFMVITPLTPKGLEALVPQPPPPGQKQNAVRSAYRGDRDRCEPSLLRSTAKTPMSSTWAIG